MKRLLHSAALVFFTLILLLHTVPSVHAAPPAEPLMQQALAIKNGILDARLIADDVESLQAFADEILPQMIGVGGEWYALALRQNDPTIDLSAYSNALQRFLRDRDPTLDGAVTHQRYAMALLAAGGGNHYLKTVAATTVGKLGHMSYVYGLHLQRNGVILQADAEQILQELLSAQGTDGGWSLAGKESPSDPDVTAMTLQALAHFRDRDAVCAAADRAFAYLSAAQTEHGDYYSYGVTCPESGAQVIVALCAWDIPIDDPRFVRQGNTLLDGILRYQLENGCFSHTLGGAENVMATVQVLYAMVALERQNTGLPPLYELPAPPACPDLTDPSVKIDEKTVLDLSAVSAKTWICLGIVAVALLACFVLFMTGKRSAKQYLSLAILAAVALAAVLLIDIQSPDAYYGNQPQSKENPIGSVTLTIRCDAVLDMPGSAFLPPDGVILAPTTFVIEQGDTAFDILTEAAALYRLRVQNTGVTATSSALAYVSGINDLKEFDFGDLSGWVYHINGKAPSVGCGEFTLSDGDEIAFLYSLTLGEDLQ
jgi:hypothetical protein